MIPDTISAASRFATFELKQPAGIQALVHPSVAKAFNPSLAWRGEELIIAYRVSTMTRCTSRHIDFAPHYSGLLPPFLNSIGVALLDPNTMTMRDAKVLPLEMPRECHWSLGYEDPRIFSYDGRVFIIAAQRDERWVFGQSIIELSPDLGIIRVLPIRPSFDQGKHQKNWNPFTLGDQLLFVASIVPHQVVSVNLETGEATLVAETVNHSFNSLIREHHVRGGTGYFHNDGELVGVCRTALRQEADANTNEYMCVAYAFDATMPFAISRRSEPFRLDRSDRAAGPIQMVTGVAEAGNDVILAYGQDDCVMKAARVSRASLLGLLGS